MTGLRFLLVGIALWLSLIQTSELGVRWIHGSDPCTANADPAIQIHRYSANTFILRQNKCIHYEAPFIYLLFGEERVFMQDTGATADAVKFPIRQVVDRVISDWLKEKGQAAIELIVAHSHGHRDHTAGDSQFADRPNTRIVGTKPEDVQRFFGFVNWPGETARFDLGGRVLDLIAIPGHEPSSIAVYDRQTKLLLTGDTLYPGRLYVFDWLRFQASIVRLTEFAQSHEIHYILGTHIEMTDRPGEDYPVRTTFQPAEHPLELRPSHLFELYSAVVAMGESVRHEVHGSFVIFPREN